MASINDETFRLLLDNVEVPIASSYKVDAGVLTVPAAFEMTIGHAAQLAELVDRFPSLTPFELRVGDVVAQTGETDGYAPTGSDGSELSITGKDLLRRIVKKQIKADRTFAEKTFAELTRIAMAECGLGHIPLAPDNTANRKAITGSTKVTEIVQTTEEEPTEAGANQQTKTKTVSKTVKGERGTTWWDFLSEQYKRAGLFLWAAVDGTFVLARPSGQQTPLYRILRRRGTDNQPGEVTVLGQPSFKFDANPRFTECHVTGLAGGGADGHGTVTGRAFDREMVELLNPGITDADYATFVRLASKGKPTDAELLQLAGFRREELYFTDKKCRTIEQCGFLARRRIAESRRAGWSLSYKVAGHTVPSLVDAGKPVVWAPDTVAYVVDDELGLDGPMYVESLVYTRQPQTTTEINLMRIEDLVYAEEDIDRPPVLARKKGIANVRVGKTELSQQRVIEMWRIDPNKVGTPGAVRRIIDDTTVTTFSGGTPRRS